MRPSTWPVALTSLAACIGGDPGALSPTEVESHAPAVALGATGDTLDYGETGGSCFRVPGVSRGTGFAQHPELALGVVWTQEAECTDCPWLATAEMYLGEGLSEEPGVAEAFDGVVSFDDTGSTRALAEIFGAQIAPGSLAEITATRTYAGTVDYRDPAAQEALSAWGELASDDARGFAWNVTRYEWSARFLISDEVADGDDEVVEVDGVPYQRTDNTLIGYEVFVCLLHL